MRLYLRKNVNVLLFIMVYFVLLFSAGYYFFENTFAVGALLIFLMIVIYALSLKKGITRNIINIFLTLCLNVLITQILTGFDFKSTLVMMITIIQALLISHLVPVKDFCSTFIKCMVIIAIVSLVGNILLIYYPNVLSIFPVLTNSKGRSAAFLIFGMISDTRMTGAQRNQGLFWEPGAYQVFLCIAYLFELYGVNSLKNRKGILLLFLVSLCSAMSTTGYIVAVALIILTIGKSKGYKSVIKMIFSSAIIIALFISIIPYIDGYWKYMFITKAQQVFDYTPGISNQSSSRMDSIYYVFKEFLHSPIWGIGTSGYVDLAKNVGHSMFTCTPINWFAIYGIFFGIFIYRNLWNLVRNFISNKFESIVALGIICLSVSSENLSSNLFFWILIFYGMKSSRNKLLIPREVNYENSIN